MCSYEALYQNMYGPFCCFFLLFKCIRFEHLNRTSVKTTFVILQEHLILPYFSTQFTYWIMLFKLLRFKRNLLLVCLLFGLYLGIQTFSGEELKTAETKGKEVSKKPIAAQSDKTTNTKTKSILYWTPWWLRNSKDWFFGIGKDVFRDCPVSDCIITDQRREWDVHKFDAVIFHSWHLFKSDMHFPQTRSKHQR